MRICLGTILSKSKTEHKLLEGAVKSEIFWV